jgi:hypothetical protein
MATRRDLSEDNQGYWDRVDRATSWIQLARSIERLTRKHDAAARASSGDWHERGRDQPMSHGYHEQFICYWIAFNALYGRLSEQFRLGMSRRPIAESFDDFDWFIDKICALDHGEGRLLNALGEVKREVHSLLMDKFLVEIYWQQGDTGRVKRRLQDDCRRAEEALADNDAYGCLKVLFWRRLRVLRNQIFHGCSTYRSTKQADSVIPAVTVVKALVTEFVTVMKKQHSQTGWAPVPFPRKDSPLWRKLVVRRSNA